MSILSNRLLVPALLALAVGAAIPLLAQTTQPTDAPATAPALHFAKQPDVIALMDLKTIEKLTDPQIADYEKTLEGRTVDFVNDLKLTDKEKEAHMKESVIAFYRALRGWHFLHDAEYNKVKNDFKNKPEPFLKAKETLLPIHKAFVDDLSSFLTPEDVWKVKNRLCYNRPMIMYAGSPGNPGFIDMVPNITEAQKAEMLACVKEVAEIAMDEGSSTDKHRVMDQYKGRLTNFVAKFKKANATQPASAPATKPAA